MPEVFTLKFFTARLYDRKLLTKVKASSSRLNGLIFSLYLHLFFHHNKNIQVNKKTPRCLFYGDAFFAAGNILENGCDQLAIIT
jgi:hypothetical protein